MSILGFHEIPMPDGMTEEEACGIVAGIMRAQGWARVEQSGMQTVVTLNRQVTIKESKK